jgi:hypothetical protein
MTRIEQFWYARPPDGTGRSPGYQVVAASSGLVGPRGFEVGAALDLCRYDPPAGLRDLSRAPESFGWIDSEELRYCFRRIPLGVDELGRLGLFAAHILIGPPDLMPAAAIAARLGSPWWWSGDVPDGADLPTLARIDEIPTGDLPQPAASAQRFVEALLRREPGRQVAVHADPAVIAAYVVATDRAVPGLMEHFTLSTHEGPQTAPWFDITGPAAAVPGSIPVTEHPDPEMPHDVREAAEILFCATTGRDVISMAAHTAGIGTETPDIGAFVTLVTTYKGLADSRVPSVALLAAALTTPTSAGSILCDYPEARDAVAAAVIDGDEELIRSLAAVIGQGVAATALNHLGGAAARQLIRSSHTSNQWGSALGELFALGPAVYGACLAELVECIADLPVAAVERLPAQHRLALLRRASASDVPVGHSSLGPLLDEIGEEWRAIVDDASFSAPWRGRALAAAYRRSNAASDSVARRLLRYPALISPFCECTVSAGGLIRILDRVHQKDRTRMALALGRAADPKIRPIFLERAGGQIASTHDRLAFLRACRADGLVTGPAIAWSHVVCEAVARALDDGLAAGAIPLLADDRDELLEWSRGYGDADIWYAVVSLAKSSTARPDLLRQALAKANQLSDTRDRAVAREFALVWFACSRPRMNALYEAIEPHGHQRSSDTMIVLARACDRVMRVRGDRDPALEYLRYVIDTASKRELRLSKAHNELLVAEVRRLLSGLDGDLRARLRARAGRTAAVARWWAGVEGSIGAYGRFVAAQRGVKDLWYGRVGRPRR